MSTPLLTVNQLHKYFPIRGGVLNKVVKHLKAVDDVSFEIFAGETFGLVGESGCGKTTAGRSILLLERPTRGDIVFGGVNLATLKPAALRKARHQMQMVFQDPNGSLNPRMRVLDILLEPLAAHGIGTKPERKELILETMF